LRAERTMSSNPALRNPYLRDAIQSWNQQVSCEVSADGHNFGEDLACNNFVAQQVEITYYWRYSGRFHYNVKKHRHWLSNVACGKAWDEQQRVPTPCQNRRAGRMRGGERPEIVSQRIRLPLTKASKWSRLKAAGLVMG